MTHIQIRMQGEQLISDMAAFKASSCALLMCSTVGMLREMLWGGHCAIGTMILFFDTCFLMGCNDCICLCAFSVCRQPIQVAFLLIL